MAEKQEDKKTKKDSKKQKKKVDYTKKIRENPWIISTVVLAVLVLLILTGSVGNCFTGKTISEHISKDEAGNRIEQFAQSQGTSAEITGVEEEAGLYKVLLKIQGQDTSIYVTKDGENLIPTGAVQPLETTNNQDQQNTDDQNNQEQTETKDVPKSDTPTAELYIFSYCPAGSAGLDTFAEVAPLLKDNADFSVKFFSNMHGEYEKQQNMIQACMQEVAPEKYWDYAKDFREEVYQTCASKRSKECDKSESIKLMDEVGIDSEEVMSCVENKGEELYQQDKQEASSLNLRYSPSFVINGVYLKNIERTPEGVKTKICESFNNAPDECSQNISAQSTQVSGSC